MTAWRLIFLFLFLAGCGPLKAPERKDHYTEIEYRRVAEIGYFDLRDSISIDRGFEAELDEFGYIKNTTDAWDVFRSTNIIITSIRFRLYKKKVHKEVEVDNESRR